MNRFIGVVCALSILLSVTAQLPPGTDTCFGQADIVVAIPAENFQYSPLFEKYLSELVSYFFVGPSFIQVGFVIYGKTAVEVLTLKDWSNYKRIFSHITILCRRHLAFQEIGLGDQNLTEAFNAMENVLKSSPRNSSQARKIGVIFTQGKLSTSFDHGLANLAAVTRLQNDGVLMYNLGYNVQETFPGEFFSIGSDACRLFSLGDLETGLRTVTPFLSSAICSELDENQTVGVEDCFPNTYKRLIFFISPPDCRHVPRRTPDFLNCNYFYQCVGSEQLILRFRSPCSDGTIYNPTTQTCVFPTESFLCR